MEEREIPDIPVSITNEVEKVIADAFLLFDVNDNKAIDPKEVETVIRALGCFPSEEEMGAFISDCEDLTMPGKIHLAMFLPRMYQKFAGHKYTEKVHPGHSRYEPATPGKLLEAFRIVDEENKGFITKEYITELMTKYGDSFSQDELDEMLDVAIDPLTEAVPYEYYLNKIMFVPKINLYDLADIIEAAKPRPEKKKRIMSVSIDDFD